MPQKWSREKAKQFVLEKAVNTPMSTTHWKKTSGLNPAYIHLYNNDFYGHLDWPTYLEKEIGFVPLRQVGNYLLPIHPTRESAKLFVTSRTKDTPMSTTHWRKTRGLKTVYRNVLQNRFFGWGGWREYLLHEIGFEERKG